MISFAGCLLVGVGGLLRLYDLGQKRLLRKCEARFPSFIVSLQAQGWRITVGDAHESVFYVLYRHEENQFVTFADEPQPRSVSTHCFLDYDTVAVADRYGNFSVMRLPATVSEAAESDGSALVVKRDGVFDSGNALEKLAEFYVGETIVSLQKAAFVHGAREAIYYVTVSGAIGVFIPFAQRNDALLSQNLELFMRTEEPAMMLGRDHLAFRSSYSPVKSVIDGDLCEHLQSLTSDRKHTASQLLDASPEELLRHLQAIRSSIGF
jgi:splicing factor 3B subunit 3